MSPSLWLKLGGGKVAASWGADGTNSSKHEYPTLLELFHSLHYYASRGDTMNDTYRLQYLTVPVRQYFSTQKSYHTGLML